MSAVVRMSTCVLIASVWAIALDAQSPKALAGWSAAEAATEARIARELAAGEPFLALEGGKAGAADRRDVLSGKVMMREFDTRDAAGKSISVDDGMVHHWVGAIFVRGVTLDDLLYQLQHTAAETYQEDVLASSFTSLGPDHWKTYLKIRRKKMMVTAVYNTEHDVLYRRLDPTRATSAAHAIKIAELDEPGTSREREKAPGQDRGYLWRWDSYWRYEQVAGGVIVECESISLSRGIPFGLGLVAGPIVKGTAKESMEKTLVAIRDRLPKHAK